MVKTNLILSEYLAMENVKLAEGKLKAVCSVKALLSEIDFNAEVIPENNLAKFTYLLTSIKGKPLTRDEIKVAMEIVNFKTRRNENKKTNKARERYNYKKA